MTEDSTSAESTTGQHTASSSAETLGAFLKRHRQSQGKDLAEVANKTHMHVSTLRAIEEDNPKALPAEVFTRGFIKNYAQYLGLDSQEALAWYIAQTDGEARPNEKINVHEVLAGEVMAEARTFSVGRFIIAFCIAAAVLFLGGYLVLNFLNSSALPVDIFSKDETHRPVSEQTPLLTAPVTGEPKAEAGAVNIDPEQAESVMPGGTGDPLLSQPGSGPEGARQKEEPTRIDGGQEGGVKETGDHGSVIVSQANKELPSSPVSALSLASSVVKAPEMHYVLEAQFTEKTWLSVQRDKEKKESFVYQPGEHAVWQASGNISLFVGNAGGVVLTLNGKPVPALGKSGQIVRVSFPSE
jgi:cytoskeleton protein RodZ